MNYGKRKQIGNRIIQEALAPLLAEEIPAVRVSEITPKLAAVGLSSRFLHLYLEAFLPTLTIEQEVILRGENFEPGTVDPCLAAEEATRRIANQLKIEKAEDRLERKFPNRESFEEWRSTMTARR